MINYYLNLIIKVYFCKNKIAKIVEEDFKDISLDKLRTDEDLSHRSYNVCLFHKYITLYDIIIHYQEKGSFNTLRNSGQKTNDELIKICNKYLKQTTNGSVNKSYVECNELEDNIINLTEVQKFVLNNLITIKINNLSTRSQKALKEYLNGDLTISCIHKNILSNYPFNYNKISNIGKVSINELTIFQFELIELIKVIPSKSEELLVKEFFLFILRSNFNISEEHYSTILSCCTNEEKIPIFKIISFLFYNNYLFSERLTYIYQNSLRSFAKEKSFSLIELSKQLGFSSERVNKIKDNFAYSFSKQISFVKAINKDFYNFHNINSESPFIFIDNDKVSLINEKEKINFDSIIITKILSLILEESHLIIGNEKSALVLKYKKLHSWKYLYLISKEMNINDAIINIANDIDNRLCSKIDKTYILDFKLYINTFLNIIDEVKLSIISKNLEIIIYHEFGIIVDRNTITFKRNTLKQRPEYIIELLEKENRPLTIHEMFGIFKNINPKLFRNENTLRANCLRVRKTRLICFGKTSTYALKEWEAQHVNLKGGTIRDLLENYLLMQDKPAHIKEIAEYIIRFRPKTNKSKIFTNIKLDYSDRFVIYNNTYVGLKSKKYSEISV